MSFTADWFSGAIPGIQRSLAGINPKRFLEIGSWEGRSASWFLDTFPESTIVCVDTFQGSEEHHDAKLDVAGVKGRFHQNMSRFGTRVTVLEGPSWRKLFDLRPESFDCVYVDGSHTEHDTLSDLVMGYHLLAPGGILLVDDYNQPEFPGIRRAVDSFASAFGVQCVLSDYQIHFCKR